MAHTHPPISPTHPTPPQCVRVSFKYFPLQGTVESLVINQQRKIFGETLLRSFCTLDDWVGLSMEDIRKLEKEVADAADLKLVSVKKAAAAISPSKAVAAESDKAASERAIAASASHHHLAATG